VVGTVYEEWLQKIIDDALKLRNTKADEEEKGEFVYIHNQLFEDLKNTNFLSSKLTNCFMINRKTWQRSIFAAEEDTCKEDVQRKENIRDFLEATIESRDQHTAKTS